MLAIAGERSGYDLLGWARAGVGYMWAPAKSRIYAVLPRLAERGLATRKDVEQSGRPDKQVYSITPEGEEAFRAWLEHEPVPEPERNPFLLKVFFGDLMDPDALLAQIRERRSEAERLRTRLAEIDEHSHGRTHDFHPRLTRRYGHEWADAVVRWADDAERELLAARAEASAGS